MIETHGRIATAQPEWIEEFGPIAGPLACGTDMSGSFVRTPRMQAIYRRLLLSTTTDVAPFVWTAGLLVGLLVGVVPVLSLATDRSPLVFALVAGVVYVAIVLATGTGFEGLASAVIVLSVFDTGVTIAQGPGYIPVSSMSLMAVDLAAVPLIVIFARRIDLWRSLRRVELDGETIATVALVGFVVWTILSAFVANGESSLSPLLDTVQFIRFGLLMALAALLVRTTNPWCVVYPLVLAVGGNLAFALAQVLHGGGFGLHALGETPTVVLGQFGFGGASVPFGSYAGGFVGHSRELTLILLLFIPIVLAVSLRRSRTRRLLSVLAVAVAVFVIRTADTDAGWAALLLMGVLSLGAFGYAALDDRHRYLATGVLTAIAGAALLAVALALVVMFRSPVQEVSVPLFDPKNLTIRIEQYVTAIDIAMAHPFFGLGSGNFYLMAEDVGLPGLRGIHGIVFSYLAATGVVGAAAYVLGTATVLLVCARRFLASTGTDELFWGALACGMIGFHAYSLWDLAHLWESALSMLWILMGVAIGARSPETRTTPQGKR